MKNWKPTADEQVESRQILYKAALREGITEEAAKRLVVEACKDERWVSRKFTKFLEDNCDPAVLQTKDDLFITPDFLYPKKDDFRQSVKEVYRIRSKHSHAGKPFPITAGIGTSPRIPATPWVTFWEGKCFPRLVGLSES